MNPTIEKVRQRIQERSTETRSAYLDKINQAKGDKPFRGSLSCGNLAHGLAASSVGDKLLLRTSRKPNIAIVSAYNDMLSAHQPFENYPDIIRKAVREVNATAQFAGGVPAMCDGVTQGQDGMELSLFSRDVIAMATAVALSHNMFDGVLCLGVCDKIVPGLLIGALSFGHLPVIFAPAGPMTSGLPNKEKARIRELYAQGKVGRDELLEAESQSYHGAGTCTFYGTANSNQMLMEVMGLHIPGSAFINPGTPLRDALTGASARRVCEITALGDDYRPLGEIINEKSIVNAITGLLVTGGSTNHTIHLIAIARAAGILVDWQDFDDISSAVPLLCRVYPNGRADVNHFHAAGGLGLVIRELIEAGLLYKDVGTVYGSSLESYTMEPMLEDGNLTWSAAPEASLDNEIIRPVGNPFEHNGGIRLMKGNLGRALVKTSAVSREHRIIEAPAMIFDDQNDLLKAYKDGKLCKDFIAVVRHQGPSANGMPELHKLTPTLSSLQNDGYKVALVTDGRMSGASGKVPAAIHLTPENGLNGVLLKLVDGDPLQLNCQTGELNVLLATDILDSRPMSRGRSEPVTGMGRELFANMRKYVTSAETGASVLMGDYE